ncbi:NAD(P)-binding protein [Sarocladium strictum]
MTETVLVVGATGNIGVSAVKGALSAGRKVLAIVRSQSSADKLVKHIGSSEGITFAEADVTKEDGVKSVVDRVRAGELPAFQHVWCSVGGSFVTAPLSELTPEIYHREMRIGADSGFYAYIATIKYLFEQNHAGSTWTICTGSQVDTGLFAMLAMGQGPIVAMCKSACRECENTNVRFNEVYLDFRVEVDEDAAAHGTTSATEFSKIYTQLLDRDDIRSTRVSVFTTDDIVDLKFAKWASGGAEKYAWAKNL